MEAEKKAVYSMNFYPENDQDRIRRRRVLLIAAGILCLTIAGITLTTLGITLPLALTSSSTPDISNYLHF